MMYKVKWFYLFILNKVADIWQRLTCPVEIVCKGSREELRGRRLRKAGI